MILNYLTNDLYRYFSLDNFFNYLTLLNDLGINKELLYLLEKLFTKDDNINPYEYLESLTTQDITFAREAAKMLLIKH